MLFQYSIPHLKAIENKRTVKGTKISAIVSELSDKYAYVIIIGGSYHVMDVQNAFVITVTIYTALCALSLLKSFNHEARPFFVADLTPTKCWIEYGNPSGHSVTSTALYLSMWNLLCRRYKPSTYWRVNSLLMTILVIFLIAVSRLYNGVHTYN